MNFIINALGNCCRIESKGSDKADLNADRIILAAAMNPQEGQKGKQKTIQENSRAQVRQAALHEWHRPTHRLQAQ